MVSGWGYSLRIKLDVRSLSSPTQPHCCPTLSSKPPFGTREKWGSDSIKKGDPIPAAGILTQGRLRSRVLAWSHFPGAHHSSSSQKQGPKCSRASTSSLGPSPQAWDPLHWPRSSRNTAWKLRNPGVPPRQGTPTQDWDLRPKGVCWEAATVQVLPLA